MMNLTRTAALLLTCVTVASSAWAQVDVTDRLLAGASSDDTSLRMVAPAATTITVTDGRPAERASIPMPLQASFVALQVLDTISTLRGFDRGLREVNPMLAGLDGRRAELVAAKAASGAATLLLVRGLARRNRTQAIVAMVAINTAYAAVVAHNVRATARR